MTKQISNESSPSKEELNEAMAKGLEYTLTQIKGDMAKALKRGDKTSAHYYREQYAVTEKIIYAIRNGRIARTDEDVERLVSGK